MSGKKKLDTVRPLQALTYAAPFAIASRYEDGFRHCVEASVAGAGALRRFKVPARPVPCAVILLHDRGEAALTIGFSPRQVYDLQGDPKPPYEEWKATVARGLPDEEHPFHEVISADDGRYVVDLTLVQLRQTGIADADAIPMTVVAKSGANGWPVVRAGE
jgi:hypothetical protein